MSGVRWLQEARKVGSRQPPGSPHRMISRRYSPGTVYLTKLILDVIRDELSILFPDHQTLSMIALIYSQWYGQD